MSHDEGLFINDHNYSRSFFIGKLKDKVFGKYRFLVVVVEPEMVSPDLTQLQIKIN
jgi:hypothetical protein